MPTYYLHYWIIGRSEPKVETLHCDEPTALIIFNRFYQYYNIRQTVLYDADYNVIMKRGV